MDVNEDLYQEVVAARSTADATYTAEWNRFKRFVQSPNNDCSVDISGKYLTRQNVDTYFVTNIATRDCAVGTALRVISALNWYSKNQEFNNVFPRFEVRSLLVEGSMERHKSTYISRQLAKYVDAHSSLPTEKVSHNDTTRLLKTALRMESWEDLFLSYNVDMQTMCRGNTLRKMRLCDIVADANHGPGNPNNPNLPLMLSFVLKRITGAKDAATYVRVIGMWPHKDFLRCGTGAIAAVLFSRFYFDITTSFRFDNADDTPPSWYNLMLVSWRTYGPMGQAYKRLYAKAKVKPAGGKITHLRKAAINDAGQCGASREHISRMSKHATDKIDTSYLCELPPEVLHVAAGFSVRHGETLYHVPRTLITFETLCEGKPDLSAEELANMIFPQRPIWINQFRDSAKYDQASENFLLVLLPHVAKVITQDGIFWVTYFPQHHVSQLLLKVFGNSYVTWAANKREWVKQSEEDLRSNQVEALNAGTQAALAGVHNQAADQGSTMARIETKVDISITTQHHILDRINAIEGRIQTHPQHIGLATIVQNEFYNNDASFDGSGNHRSMGLQQGEVPVESIFGITRQRMLELAPDLGRPAIPMGMPPTIQILLFEHLELKLDDYAKANKKNWPSALCMRFSRRGYLFREVMNKADSLRCGDRAANMQEAARILDNDRQCMSLTKFYAHLKASDTTSHKRKRD